MPLTTQQHYDTMTTRCHCDIALSLTNRSYVMAGLNAADIVQIKVNGTLFGQQIITSFHYQVVIPSTQSDTVTACTILAGSWSAGAVSPFLAFMACCSPQYECDTITAQRIAPIRYRAGRTVMGLPGTNANDTTTTNQAAVVTKATTLSGRAEVGSWHIPGLAQANIVDGSLSVAFKVLASTFASKTLNTFTDLVDGTLVIKPVLYHYRKPPLLPVAPLQLFTAFVQPTARVMRRRTVGVGK